MWFIIHMEYFKFWIQHSLTLSTSIFHSLLYSSPYFRSFRMAWKRRSKKVAKQIRLLTLCRQFSYPPHILWVMWCVLSYGDFVFCLRERHQKSESTSHAKNYRRKKSEQILPLFHCFCSFFPLRFDTIRLSLCVCCFDKKTWFEFVTNKFICSMLFRLLLTMEGQNESFFAPSFVFSIFSTEFSCNFSVFMEMVESRIKKKREEKTRKFQSER